MLKFRNFGRKSLAVNLSDLAAMGGKPCWALLSLAIPAGMDLDFLDPFLDGMLGMAAEFGVALIGGDTCSSRSGLVLSITLFGEQCDNREIYRAGAQAGDRICVSGTIGDSALGLLELRRGSTGGDAVARHLDPFPRCRVGEALADRGCATAMIDLSDGFLADLGHILELSGKGARIETSALPLSRYFMDHAGVLVDNPLELALSGGEDYELLFTLPSDRLSELDDISRETGTPLTVVGEITADSALRINSADGDPITVTRQGYRHF